MSEQREVVILSGVRTAIGDFGGGLKDVAPTELGASGAGSRRRRRSTRRRWARWCSAT